VYSDTRQTHCGCCGCLCVIDIGREKAPRLLPKMARCVNYLVFFCDWVACDVKQTSMMLVCYTFNKVKKGDCDRQMVQLGLTTCQEVLSKTAGRVVPP
jgi:hypothetical protein